MAIGEEFSSKWQFLPYLEEKSPPTPGCTSKPGESFTEAMQVAGYCEAHYINLMPHNPLGPVKHGN